MAAKLIVVLALAVAGHSSVVPLDHAAIREVEPVSRADDVTSFSYNVADPYTGDFKSQSETRVGGTVQGQYSLLDADGTTRTVNYAADDFNGFNAVVRKDAVAVGTPVVAERTVVKPALARTVAVPNVVNTGAVVASPSVYAASAPLVTRTVFNTAPVVATGRYTTPILAGGNLVDSRSLVTPSGFAGTSNLLSAHTLSRPSVFTGVSPVVTTHTFGAPSVVNAPFLSRTVAAPLVASPQETRTFVSSPLATRTLINSPVYAASAPLVNGGYTTSAYDALATRTLSAPFVTTGSLYGEQTLLTPHHTFSGRLVTGGDYVRTDSGW